LIFARWYRWLGWRCRCRSTMLEMMVPLLEAAAAITGDGGNMDEN